MDAEDADPPVDDASSEDVPEVRPVRRDPLLDANFVTRLLGLSDPSALNATNVAMAADVLNRFTAARHPATARIVQQYAQSIVNPSAAEVLANLERLGVLPSLTDPKVYAAPDPPKAAYTPQMTSPGAYFARDEKVIDSFKGLNEAIATLIDKAGDLTLVWRGAQNSDWGIHSALYRRLMALNGVKAPSERPRGVQPYPTEEQMVAAERLILQVAREEWRLDGLSAMETFARIQHAGGPTRLLDVTKNPFIAAWFAVEQTDETESCDARLIAFATAPVPKEPGPPIDSQIALDDQWAHRDPAWHLFRSNAIRQALDWGTGARRRVWVPPHYDQRILVQNAAFLIDGVPITSARTQPYFRSSARGAPATYWSRADLLASASMYVRTASPSVKARYNKPNLAPTFTFRITANAKTEIRDFLVSRFGYTRSSIYPDVPALATYIKQMDLPGLTDSDTESES